MPHIETFMAAVLGKNTGKSINLVSDEHFSDATGGLAVGHISLEAYDSGPLALIENDDIISIDIEGRSLYLDVSDEELAHRKEIWRAINKPAGSWLNLYRKGTTSVHQGATIFLD